MYVQTAETPKNVDVEREISKFKNGKQMDMAKSRPN